MLRGISLSNLSIFNRFSRPLFPLTRQQQQLRLDLMSMMELAQKDFQKANSIAEQKILKGMSPTAANEFCNLLLRRDEEFRTVCKRSVRDQLRKATPHISWQPLLSSHEPVPVFRSLAVNSFSNPAIIFQEGMPAPIFNIRSHHEVFSPTRIVTYRACQDSSGKFTTQLTSNNRLDKLGAVYGSIMSASLSIAHAADQRYVDPDARFKQDRYIYLMALTEGYNMAAAIYEGSGYIRNKGIGVSNSEDAAEIGAGVFVSNTNILGFRKIDKNGELGDFEFNTYANRDVFETMKRYIDVAIFLEAKNIQEVRELEALLTMDPTKVEDFYLRLHKYHARDHNLQRRIMAEARYRTEPHKQISELLRQHLPIVNDDNESQLSLFSQSFNYARLLEDGVLRDAKQLVFHSRKAATEEELKIRAIEAKKLQLEQQPKVDTIPIPSFRR